jgi:hypothetical protein
MSNVDRCDPLEDWEKLRYKNEARFCRAFYYFCMMRQWGPIIIVNSLTDHDDFSQVPVQDTYDKPRNTWDECVKYVLEELDILIDNKLLPDAYTTDSDKGRATLGAAMGVKAMLLLYNASPLFNPVDPTTYIYRGVKNLDGTNLFPTAYDEGKWEDAADAAYDVIASNLYSLMPETVNSSTSYDKIYFDRWNNEIIWGYNRGATGGWGQSSLPRGISPSSWGGFGVTQNAVDAYAMKGTGRYPLRLDGEKYRRANGVFVPNLDASSGYTEDGFTEGWVHPIDGAQETTYNMYIGRDPRFYMNVIWGGQSLKFTSTPEMKHVAYYYNSISGPGLSHDYSPTGYSNRKATRRDVNINSTVGNYDITWPYLRYANILLMYAEALNEYDPGNPDILSSVNQIRTRWDMPGLDKAYPEIDFTSTGSKARVRELIKRERQVELYAEFGARYFDVRRWMDAETMLHDTYGMNVFANGDEPTGNPDGTNYWQRTMSERRVFSPKNYLYPFSQSDINNNPSLVQNYGY